eukprot:TCONS_00008286-protein
MDITTKEIAFVVSFTIIFLVAVCGNSIVIYVFRGRPRMISSMELAIYYLAIIDLIASIFNPVLYIYWHLVGFHSWHFGAFFCTLFPSIITVSLTMSLGLILLITIERCRLLVNPFNKIFTKKRMRMLVCLVLVLSILNELPYIVYNRVQEQDLVENRCFNESRNTTFSAERSCSIHSDSKPFNLTILNETFQCVQTECHKYSFCAPLNTINYKYPRIVTLLLRDVIFLSTLVVSNILIYRALKDTERVETLKRLSATTADPDRTLKMLFLNALVFTFLVLPKDLYFIVYTLSNFNKEILDRDTGTTINSALKLLQQCNCIVNIFIYSRLHASFRHKIKRTFTKK